MGAAHAYQDPGELIGDPEIDAVHVWSTNHLHAADLGTLHPHRGRSWVAL
jgi:hypothetical protein